MHVRFAFCNTLKLLCDALLIMQILSDRCHFTISNYTVTANVSVICAAIAGLRCTCLLVCSHLHDAAPANGCGDQHYVMCLVVGVLRIRAYDECVSVRLSLPRARNSS
jgi:hypothetical protein